MWYKVHLWGGRHVPPGGGKSSVYGMYFRLHGWTKLSWFYDARCFTCVLFWSHIPVMSEVPRRKRIRYFVFVLPSYRRKVAKTLLRDRLLGERAANIFSPPRYKDRTI